MHTAEPAHQPRRRRTAAAAGPGRCGQVLRRADVRFSRHRPPRRGRGSRRTGSSRPREGANFEPEAIERILALTAGYPYFLQEYGKHLWNLAAGPVVTLDDVMATEPIVQLQLDDNFFRVPIARTTGAELTYLSAMADLGEGPYRSGDIATRLGRPGPQGLAPVRARLIDKGLIFSPAYGLNEFTVPAFSDFLRRNYPHRPKARRKPGT